MAFTRHVAGNPGSAAEVNEVIEAWEGDAGAGEPFNCTQVNDAALYAGDFRNMDAANSFGLRVRNDLNEILLQLDKDLLTIGKNVTCLAGVTLDSVDVGIHTHTGAAGHGPTIDHTDVTTIGVGTHAELDTHVAGAVGAAGVQGHIPIGGIIMWSGAVGAIPADWSLCDGTAGTPDLTDRFVVGAGAAYAVGAVGGASTVNLQHRHLNNWNTGWAGGHKHLIPYMNVMLDPGAMPMPFPSISPPETDTFAAHRHAVNEHDDYQLSATQENRPLYYALAYIMRVS